MVAEVFCRYHCRSCGGHFTSLLAFDAHEPRHPREGCVYPDEPALTERRGNCRISDPTEELTGVVVYEHPRSERGREHFARRRT